MCVRNHFNHVYLDVRKLATVGETVTDGKGSQLAITRQTSFAPTG